MLGGELAKVYKDHEVTLWDRETIDITDPAMLRFKVSGLSPDIIINCAAYNDVDGAEENFETAMAINADGPINLAKLCQERGIILVHYSTDYVFPGDNENGYSETDEPCPLSKYGESKFYGEKVTEFCDKAYLIRTSRLFGRAGIGANAKKSFVEKMLIISEGRSEIELVNEEKGCPTYAKDLAEATKELIEAGSAFGIYHLVNDGACTWYEFGTEVFRLAGKNVKTVPVPAEKFERPAQRPLFSELHNTKAPKLRPWKDALAAFLRDLGKLKAGDVVAGGELRVAGVEKKEVVPQKENIQTTEPSRFVNSSESLRPSVALPKVASEQPISRPAVLPETPVLPKEPPQMPRIQTVKAEPVAIVPKEEKTVPEEVVVDVKKSISADKSLTRKNMKGIILSGGKGTRLYPLTKITSKQLLPVYDKPMIMYPFETLVRAGIKDILIIVSPECAGQYLHLLGSGKEYGVNLSYEIQDEPKGLPEAFIIGEKFIGDDNVAMILGDNLFFDHDFKADIESFEKGGRVFAVQVPDPQRFGVVEFDQNGRVISIEEKPAQPKSNYAIPGMYIYDNRVCHLAKNIKPTWRPETDITELHKAYLAMQELDVKMIKGRWIDAGTFESLLKASNIRATQVFQEKMMVDKNVVTF